MGSQAPAQGAAPGVTGVLRVVLDANVYVSAALSPRGPPGQILETLLRAEAFQIVVTPAIVAETLRALAYAKVRRLVRGPVTAEDWFEDIVVLADLTAGDTKVVGVCDDPDDDKYLAAAIEGRATAVVTGDRKLLAVVEHAGVRVITPRRFLEMLE